MILPYWLISESIFPTYYIPLYIGLVFEIWGSSLILLAFFRRRNLWGLRIGVGAACMVGVAIGLGFLRNLASDSLLLRMGCSFILYGCVLAMLFVCFDETPIDILLIWISIMAIREAADGIDTLLRLAFQTPSGIIGYSPDLNIYVNGLIFDVIHLAVQLPLGFLFAHYKSSTKDKGIIFRTALLSFCLMVFSIVIKAMVVQHSSESKTLYGAAVSLTLLLSLFTLFLRTDALIGSQKTRELEMINGILITQQKQFEESKQSIALINAKVHDIKHRIDEFGDQIAAETLEQLKSSIVIYDRPFHTGSQVLDTILYTKSLECDSCGIRITAIGDGRPIHFIPSSKRFYLFSNILDNAIEAAKQVQDPDKRIIGVSLKQEAGVFIIEEYNYFEGVRIIENGSLKTTKRDNKMQHGLGLKSIRQLVEEYNGEVSISIEKDMFFLRVSIPLQK